MREGLEATGSREGEGRLTGNAISRNRYGAFTLLFLILTAVFFVKVYSRDLSFFSVNTLPQNIESASTDLTGAGRFIMTGRIDINAADIEGLALLPGIGRGIAARIIIRRTELGGFASIDDLLGVEGIGARRLAAIKAFLQR